MASARTERFDNELYSVKIGRQTIVLCTAIIHLGFDGENINFLWIFKPL
jgi:hypothetical protein